LDILLPDAVYYLSKTALRFLRTVVLVREEPVAAGFEFWAVVLVPLKLSWLTALFTRAIYVKVAGLMVAIDQPGSPVDHDPKTCLSIFDAIRGITMQQWHSYLHDVWKVAAYEYLWVCFSFVVIIAELHYLAPCAVMDLLVWYTQDW
jgi:hypothetical protein